MPTFGFRPRPPDDFFSAGDEAPQPPTVPPPRRGLVSTRLSMILLRYLRHHRSSSEAERVFAFLISCFWAYAA